MRIVTAHSLKGNPISVNENGPPTSYPTTDTTADFPHCESPVHASAADDVSLTSSQENNSFQSNSPHDRRPFSGGPRKESSHDRDESTHSGHPPYNPPLPRAQHHSHGHEPWNPDSSPSRSRPRTNSMLSLSLAFVPRQGSADSDFEGLELPTNLRSMRTLNTFPTRPHTLFSLSRTTSTTSTSSTTQSTSSRGLSWDVRETRRYDVTRKSPLATAEVLSSTHVTKDDENWTPLHSRPSSSPLATSSLLAKGKGRAVDLERPSDVPFPSHAQDTPTIDTGRSARDVLSALYARERASSLSTPVRQPTSAAGSTPEHDSSSSEGLLSRMRTRVTSLRPLATFSWSSTATPALKSPEDLTPSEIEPPMTPTLIVTSPSTSPDRPFDRTQTASELYPSSPTQRRLRPLPSSPQHKSATLPSPLTHRRNSSFATSGAMPPLHPSLAAVERSSRLLKATVRCAVCGDAGKDFPRCGRCGEAWCSRECRVKNLAGKKRHTCASPPAGSSTNPDIPNPVMAAI